MAYFPDLSSYAYGIRSDPNNYREWQHRDVVHVGWLDGVHDYPKGEVAPHLIAKLKKLAQHPVELYRGKHICELCPPSVTNVPVGKDDSRYASAMRSLGDIRHFCPAECMSNGEIRISIRTLLDGSALQHETTPTPVEVESALVLYRKSLMPHPFSSSITSKPTATFHPQNS